MGFLMHHLLPRLAYLDQGWHAVARAPSGQGVEMRPLSRRRPPVVVLGRRHYVETFRRYPITDRRDLLAAIRLDLEALSPFRARAGVSSRGWWWIAARDGEGSAVNFWFPTPEAEDALDGAWLVLPETLLLAHAPVADGCVLHVQGDPAYFFHVAPTTGVVSQVCAGLVRDAGDFLHMAGLRVDGVPRRELAAAEKAAALLAGWERLEPRALSGLWQWRGGDPAFLARRWRRELGGVVALGVLYLALSSYYLHHTRHNLEEELAGFRQEMAHLLTRETRLRDLAHRHDLLARPVAEQVGRWRAFALLERIVTSETRIHTLRIDRNTVELTGLTPRASELLGRFQGVAGVAEPRFTTSVTSTRDGENFTIRFELQRPDDAGGGDG